MAARALPFGALQTLSVDGKQYQYASLKALEKAGLCKLDELPVSIKVLLESVLRNVGHELVTEADVRIAAAWKPTPADREIPFMPSRVLLQDFTGVPAVVDFAAMRDAVKILGGNPEIVNPLVPADLVIDHSVQVDAYAVPNALAINMDREYQRNRERYLLLKWGQQAYQDFRVVPPGMGICHQVNLEYLSSVVHERNEDGARWAFPDTLVGMDSHTTMVGGIAVVGWGVGGIEAEAVMLGQPYFMKLPEVIGIRLQGELPEGSTATDLVLLITERMRKLGVVDKFIEFFGPGLKSLTAQDRATIANMAPEQGSTISFFPIDEVTLDYLRQTGRDETHVRLVEAYARAQGLWAGGSPQYTKTVDIDLGEIEPTLAGPSRPHDRVALRDAAARFNDTIKKLVKDDGMITPPTQRAVGRLVGEGGHSAPQVLVEPHNVHHKATVEAEGGAYELKHGDVVIGAITSCTNTSNPSVMLGAGILAKKALERGLKPKPWVKTSMAPGSRVVTDYLQRSGLLSQLEKAGFGVVGYGCTTCIGNAGPLADPIEAAVKDHELVVCAVLSGNRNFEARIHPLVRANYLASPPLVVAYAFAGTITKDLSKEPLGTGKDGKPVFLRELWPTAEELRTAYKSATDPQMYRTRYATVTSGDERWQALSVRPGRNYDWDNTSTYVRSPPFFEDFRSTPVAPADIRNARVLAVFGDTITTDHISPAGPIEPTTPAGQWLLAHGVKHEDFNQYGARRGNHEVMIRGTFANVRIKNQLVLGTEGGVTIHLPDKRRMSIYEASETYRREGVPLIVVAGKEYGSGSSRDWAAKGTALLGVKAVLAKSFERIHRSNLIGMGVLPLEFLPNADLAASGLDGTETYEVHGVSGIQPRASIQVTATNADGSKKSFQVRARLDTAAEVKYYQEGGILPAVLRRLVKTGQKAPPKAKPVTG